MRYKIRIGWMEEIVPTGFSPAWMVENEVQAAAEPKEVELDVEAANMREALKKAAETAGIDLKDANLIVVNGMIIRNRGDGNAR